MSAYSLKSLAQACRPLMSDGRLGRRADLRRDRGLAGVRLDGRGQGRRSSPARATSPATSARGHPGQPGLGRSAEDPGREGDPRLRGVRGDVERPGAARLGQRRPRAGRQGGLRPAVATGSRRPPARSCTSTAASTRWAPDVAVPSSLVELRVLGGPQPLLPARGDQADARHRRAGRRVGRAAPRLAARIGLRDRAPGGAGVGFPAAVRDAGGGAAGARGRHGVGYVAARRSGCDRPATRTQLVVAFPWRNRERAQELGRGGGRGARRGPGADGLDDAVEPRRRAGGRAPSPAPRRTRSSPRCRWSR